MVIRCNRCGKELDMWDMQENFTIENPDVGYGSEHDGESIRLRLCCKCFDKLVRECEVSPVTRSYRGWDQLRIDECWEPIKSGLIDDE